MERSAWPKNLSSSRKQAIKELLDGQNPTKKIRHLFDAHSQTGNNTAQPSISEDLIVNVLRSSSNTLSLSSSAAESNEILQVPSNACVRSEVSEGSESINNAPPVPTNACVRSEDSEESESIHTSVPRGMEITEALRVQMELQGRLHEELESQRQLQLRIKEKGRYLQKVIAMSQSGMNKLKESSD